VGLKDRVFNATHGVLTKVMSKANAALDVPTIRLRFNANKGLITEIRTADSRYRNWVQLGDGGLRIMRKPRNTNSWGDRTWFGDGLLEFRDYPTLINLIRGKKLRKDLATGKDYWSEYTPQDAYFYGDIRTFGDQASNEALRFILEVWPQIAAQIKAELGIR
jgi:hypothetical protein